MYKTIVILIIVLLILILGNIFITREGFQTSSVASDNECSFDDEERDSDCNKIEDSANDSSFSVHNVCPNDPRCLGVCINDHTWTDANKRSVGYVNANTGDLKNPEYAHLISSSRCGECIKNFYEITRLILDKDQCNI